MGRDGGGDDSKLADVGDGDGIGDGLSGCQRVHEGVGNGDSVRGERTY